MVMTCGRRWRRKWARYVGDVLVFVYGRHIFEGMTQGVTMEVRTTSILSCGNSIGQDINGWRGESKEYGSVRDGNIYNSRAWKSLADLVSS